MKSEQEPRAICPAAANKTGGAFETKSERGVLRAGLGGRPRANKNFGGEGGIRQRQETLLVQ